MKKVSILFFILVATFAAQAQQTEAYGPYYGVNIFVNKSNLFNSDDLRTDSFQKYKMTPSVSGSVEYGYLYDNGFSVSLGLQWGTANQKYTGEDIYLPYKMTATTKSSYLKIPLLFNHQTRNDKKFKFMYTLGFFYSLNTGYSDKIVLDYIDPNSADFETNITKKGIETTNTKDTNKTSYTFDQSVVRSSGLGAIVGAGISYRLKERTEFTMQIKSEFQFNNSENSDEILFTPTGSTTGNPLLHRVYGNYAKYMNVNNTNYGRATTHPFNVGITLGLRFYVFTF
jgi:hypothetical protein